jgi:hypothetical protein
MHALPVCPRPYESEAARSWLSRVGQVYGLKAERLIEALGLAVFKSDYKQRISPSVEAVLDSHSVDQLAIAAQLPSARIAEMLPGPVEWILTVGKDCAVCARCLDEDLGANRQPYLRAAWQQAWRIFCPIHEVRLVSCTVKVVTGQWTGTRLTDAIDEAFNYSTIVEGNIDYLLGRDTEFIDRLLAIKTMESVIGRAAVGEPPNSSDWGPLSSTEFLRVVHDVTTWALTNFESFKARPVTEDRRTRTGLEGSPFHVTRFRFPPPFEATETLRHISTVIHPELRCAALWWANALLCNTHPSPIQSPQSRQTSLLRGRCPAGLYWLFEQMAHWPESYVRQQWIPLDQLF